MQKYSQLICFFQLMESGLCLIAVHAVHKCPLCKVCMQLQLAFEKQLNKKLKRGQTVCGLGLDWIGLDYTNLSLFFLEMHNGSQSKSYLTKKLYFIFSED